MPQIQADYSYFVREEGTVDSLFVNDLESETIDAAVQEYVEELFADSGDKIKDIQMEAYMELKE
jgi:hypothetical protein